MDEILKSYANAARLALPKMITTIFMITLMITTTFMTKSAAEATKLNPVSFVPKVMGRVGVTENVYGVRLLANVFLLTMK